MSWLDGARETMRRDRVFDFMLPAVDPQAAIDASHGPILYLEDVTVSFDGFKALDALTLYINDGELRCIIGPNGAGKSTMMDVITGRLRPDAGEAWLGQRLDLLRMPETEISRAGIGRKFQKPTVFPEHRVVENLELAMTGPRGVWSTLGRRLTGEDRDRIDAALSEVGLQAEGHLQAGQLSHGQKQWLEIGMLLMQNPRVLLVDEPVAGMTHQEMDRTADLLQRLAGRHSVVLVEHDMDFVRSIARTVTVLHQGAVLAEGPMDQIQSDPRVIEVYLGE